MDEIRNISELLKINLAQITPEMDEKVKVWEQMQADERRIRHYRQTVPQRYWNESLDTYKADTDERHATGDAVRQFAHAVELGAFRTLILLGAVGTGKTHLACGIIRNVGGLYRLSSTIVEEIRHAKSFGAKETEADILDGYGRTCLLVIDEIGRSSAAQEEQYALYQIINERYNRRKPTVLISNQTKKEFLNYVGIAAADRLSESAQCIEFTGMSYRAEIRHSGGGCHGHPARV